MSHLSRRTTALDYKLPQTVEYIQQGWLNTCQSSAAISGFLTVTSTLLLLFFKNIANFDSARNNSHGILLCLDIVGYASIFLNISSCMSCFILLDRLGEVPYNASRDPNVPMGGRTTMGQESVLRTYGIGALWKWVIWHWLFCFVTGLGTIFAQILIYIWLQESSQTQVALSCIGAFCILPFVAFLLAPVVNSIRKRNQGSDTESARTPTPRPNSGSSPVIPYPSSPIIPPSSPISTIGPRDRHMSMATSFKGAPGI
ncbi:hypothetical protein BDN70DRAFT_589063 [Pholiota conissans]|uniref:Uncharacterized protein n=1 Tax=Pholiota conissans TaxID=109636 RepID=A0A9P5ZDJ6_9AGAR|nr:hypothetical protein BDN70DRAFT_589063 [Pholiota conissans]